MIHIADITGIKYDVSEKVRTYVSDRVGRVEKYLPRHARKSAQADVKLKQSGQTGAEQFEAEIILQVPDKVLTASAVSNTMYAAIDASESKLKAQLQRYKTETVPHIGNRGVLSRFKRGFGRESQ